MPFEITPGSGLSGGHRDLTTVCVVPSAQSRVLCDAAQVFSGSSCLSCLEVSRGVVSVFPEEHASLPSAPVFFLRSLPAHRALDGFLRDLGILCCGHLGWAEERTASGRFPGSPDLSPPRSSPGRKARLRLQRPLLRGSPGLEPPQEQAGGQIATSNTAGLTRDLLVDR